MVFMKANKKFFWGLAAALLVLAGCGAKNNSSASPGPDGDFFAHAVQGEITISAYDSMRYRAFLEDAARSFQAQYPGTTINVETFSAMPEIRSGGQGNVAYTQVQMQDDPQSRADYISRVNTNLMSGTGADIFAMDVIPLHKFVESGTLENLEPYMNGDPLFNRADYRQNIIDALRYRNGTWFLPIDYMFNYFAYDATLVPEQIAAGFGTDKAWSTEELFNVGMSLYDGNYKLFNAQDFSRGGGMFDQLLSENIRSFINLDTGRANFADGSFTYLLDSVKTFSEQGLIPQGVTGQQNAGQMMQGAMADPTDRYFFKLNNSTSLVGQFTRSFGMMMRMMSAGSSPAVDTDDEVAGIQANADGSVPFTYSQAYGINSQSKNKELAWAFIKYLLTREIQLSSQLLNMALPMNNEARAERAELSFSALPGGSRAALNDQQREALEKYMIAVESLSSRINTFVVQDSSLNDMIRPEVQYFFSGSRNADEVARVLQNRADLYLSE